MICPSCGQTISDSALRCRHCRKALSVAARPPQAAQTLRRLIPDKFYPRFADEMDSAWGILEVLLLFAAYFAGAFCLRAVDFGFAWIEWLRQNFFIFTREPLLQVYIYIFVETFVLKLGTVLLILFYLAFRGQPVMRSLALSGSAQNHSTLFFRCFFILSIAVAWWQGLDPLAPDLPTPLFFSESATLGNALTVLSIALVAPVTEEIIFRGFMYPAFSRGLGKPAAIFLTSVLFAAAHAPQMAGAYGHLWVIFLVGALLTWHRAVTGLTRQTIFLHALYNACLMAAGFLRFSFYGF